MVPDEPPALGDEDFVLDSPVRPIQYLGSKLRMLDKICSATESLVGKNADVADLFTGSTVVAQSMALRGHTTTAVDTESYAMCFASAFLGVGKLSAERVQIEQIESFPLGGFIGSELEIWEKYSRTETAFLGNHDTAGLGDLYLNIPLIWKRPESPFYSNIEKKSEALAFSQVPLIASLYSGTYFGIKQSLEIDSFLHNINALWTSGKISPWQFNAYKSAVMSAASACVHSAGKHFAQPLGRNSVFNQDFKDKRLISDRSISVRDKVLQTLNQLNGVTFDKNSGHSAFTNSAESYTEKPNVKHDLLYLDPPYTAQQYSRFYHILSVIDCYKFPHMVLQNEITKGLYSTNRYKSAFCSKRQAPDAFRKIISSAHSYGASLVISYSQSKSGSHGNARMISLEGLLNTCVEFYGISSVESSEENHSYRQFNSSQNANQKRNDPEVLILCKKL